MLTRWQLLIKFSLVELRIQYLRVSHYLILDEIFNYFSNYGKILDINLIKNRQDGKKL